MTSLVCADALIEFDEALLEQWEDFLQYHKGGTPKKILKGAILCFADEALQSKVHALISAGCLGTCREKCGLSYWPL